MQFEKIFENFEDLSEPHQFSNVVDKAFEIGIIDTFVSITNILNTTANNYTATFEEELDLTIFGQTFSDSFTDSE